MEEKLCAWVTHHLLMSGWNSQRKYEKSITSPGLDPMLNPNIHTGFRILVVGPYYYVIVKIF